uniref:Uncharacterized protein n=1 Tax=Fagus sylvatica TaxID=28930 RepID=A0A2N9HU15_FAGSY
MGWVYGGLTMVDVLREATRFGSELHDGDCEFVLRDAGSMFRGGGVGLCFVAVGRSDQNDGDGFYLVMVTEVKLGLKEKREYS